MMFYPKKLGDGMGKASKAYMYQISVDHVITFVYYIYLNVPHPLFLRNI